MVVNLIYYLYRYFIKSSVNSDYDVDISDGIDKYLLITNWWLTVVKQTMKKHLGGERKENLINDELFRHYDGNLMIL